MHKSGSGKPKGEKRVTAKLGRPVRIAGEKHTKERIFDAAVDLFAERGYDRTSVRQIAEAVGLTESAVYRHYPSKEAILDAIIAYLESQANSPLPAESGRKEGAGSSIFSTLLLSMPRMIMADPNLVKITRIMFAEMNHNESIRKFLQKEFGEKAEDDTEAVFKQQMESGSILPCDPRALARVFNAFRGNWLLGTFVIDRDERLDLEKLEKDMKASIEFFEKLLVPGAGGK
jgi:AcrR family transcriptional regulator